MANYQAPDTEFQAVANAIRAKGGTQAQLEWPNGFILAIQNIPTPTPSASWSSGTDSEIASIIQSAHAGEIDLQQDCGWAVGDTRTIYISAFTDSAGTVHSAQSIDIVISSFDDYNNCGCVMQFDFKDQLATDCRMNLNSTNIGGYGSTEMYITTLPALVNALPSWLKDALIEFSVLASAGDKSSSIQTITGNKLALRSEIEIFGVVSNSIAGEGSQIPYYTTPANRIKKRGHSGLNDRWYERSPYYNNNASFCCVTSSGLSDYSGASYSRGIAPFGCI